MVLWLLLLRLSVIIGANSDEKPTVFTVEIRPSCDFNFLISLFLYFDYVL